MAYKFQLDPAIMSGSLVQEGATEIVGNLTSTAQISGSTLALGNAAFTVSAAGAIAGATSIDGSGDLTVGTITMAEFTVAANGNTDIDGTLNVQGIPTFQAQSVHSAGGTFNSAGLAACGAIAGASTIDASGDLTVGSITNAEFTVDASGNTDIDGTLNVQLVPTFQAQSVHSAGGTFNSAGLAACGAVSGVTTYSAVGAHVTSGSITQSGAGAVLFEGILQVTGATTLKSTLSAGATTLSSAKVSDLTDNRIVFAGTDGELEDSSKLTFDGADLTLGASTRIIAVEAELSGDLTLSGAAGTAVAVGADSIYFLDATSGKVRRDNFASLASAMAGGGLTAVSGVLSTQAGTVSGGMDGGTATEGYNYFTGTVNAAIKLPASPSNGDLIVIKAGNTTTGQNITINCQGSHLIDNDATNIHLESPYAAVSLVYVKANDWRIV
jgi:hypothetical protein